CGDVPTMLRSLPTPGLHGIAHEVTVRGEQGTLTVRGTYRVGEPWRYEPPELRLAAGVAGGGPLGSPEQGPGDPWYRANARAIGAVVDAVRGAPLSPLLFDWNAALALDRTAQASLSGTVLP
ncbi:MAG TPA: hypothetical protein VES02_17750, partial [Dermatophilaceae bacterium]|nr:hypothetical protein [Dermatophilaceae bacterium]